jgi:uncharacterized protein (DUF2384 family)
MNTPEYRDRVNRMMLRAIEHFGQREAAVRWMLGQNWRLDRRAPIDCLRDGEEWSAVERALEAAPLSSAA